LTLIPSQYSKRRPPRCMAPRITASSIVPRILANKHTGGTQRTTGFTVPSGHYEFNKLPFGLSNSPSSFQRLMDIVLKHLVGIHCLFFPRRCCNFLQDSARTRAETGENTPPLRHGKPATKHRQVRNRTTASKLPRVRAFREGSLSLT
jgi:hypothetical protein